VLSRTLFVGGAGGTEGEIRAIFSRFGRVQTCIVNQDKRHAFVKMLTRPDAVAAKEGMDNLQDPAAQSKARQVLLV
jgi:protein NRD1